MGKQSEERLPLAGNIATSEEHIYTYDTDKNRRSVPNTPGRKQFKIICIVLGVVGIYLLGFSIFLAIRGGYTDANFNDLNSNCRYAMLILSIFVIFVSITGYAGAYTNWKPIILTFSVLVSMGVLGHLYVAKKCLDAARFTERDLAIAWWDTYNDYIRAEIQDKYSCCGYQDYKDLPVASNYCLSNEVDAVLQYTEGIKDAANVLKNDSYRKKFGDADSSSGTISTDKNKAAGANKAADNAAAANTAADNTAADNTAADNTAADNTVADNAAAGNAAVDNTADAAVDAAVDTAANAGAGAVADQGAVAVGKRNINVYRFEETLRRRQVMADAEANQIKQDLNIYKAQGCKKLIVPLIKKKLKFLYIFNYILTLVYVAACGQSLVYWQNMRKEKEFDEFA